MVQIDMIESIAEMFYVAHTAVMCPDFPVYEGERPSFFLFAIHFHNA